MSRDRLWVSLMELKQIGTYYRHTPREYSSPGNTARADAGLGSFHLIRRPVAAAATSSIIAGLQGGSRTTRT
jgi:hypothetical protein